MKYILICVMIYSLFGCGIEDYISDDTNNLSSDCELDCSWDGIWQERNSEFYIDYTPHNPKRPMLPYIVHWWEWLQQCTGFDVDISGTPLVIDYVPVVGDGVVGRIWEWKGYARVLESDTDKGRITRHEMLHYLLYQIGSTTDDNHNHLSSYWQTCDVERI